MIKDLQGLIAIKSISGVSTGEYPYGEETYRALEYCLNLCKQFGFKTKKCKNYMGYAEIGQGAKLMGILVHVDVVPAGTGWNTNPFQGIVIGDKIFGRGVIDDKGPAVAVIYAMKDILDSNIPLDKRIRIIFGCSEENGNWTDMEFYKRTEEVPDFGFTPDADFPLIYAEKGIAILNLKMPKVLAGVETIEGGEVSNMVAATCVVTLVGNNGEKICVEKIGKSAHGSMPYLGVNAIGLAMKEINQMEKEGKLSCNIARFYMETIGETVNGELLNCHLVDDVTGEITINAGVIKADEKDITITLDIRIPIGFAVEDVIDRISKKVNKYGVSVELIEMEKSVFLDKKSPYILGLMEAYKEITGDDTQPMTMGGGTYARAMDNIVAFGPTFPGRECTEHQPNENVLIEDLYQARKIYRLAMEKA